MRRKPTMQLVRNNVGRAELAIALALLVLFLFAWTAGPAFAGADTTFDTALNTFTDFLEGSGGKLITVLSLAGGIVAPASGRFSLGQKIGRASGRERGCPIV